KHGLRGLVPPGAGRDGSGGGRPSRRTLALSLAQPGEPLVLLQATTMPEGNLTLAALVNRYGIRVEAPPTVRRSGWEGGAVLAPWATDDVLRCIDDDLKGLVESVCAISWRPDHHSV